MSWIAEHQAPDGTWHRLFAGQTARDVIRQLRRWRSDQGHLTPETRVRVAAD